MFANLTQPPYFVRWGGHVFNLRDIARVEFIPHGKPPEAANVYMAGGADVRIDDPDAVAALDAFFGPVGNGARQIPPGVDRSGVA